MDIPAMILEQNPWWDRPEAIESDPMIRRYDQAPFRWRPGLVDDLETKASAVYTIRGPRRAGKSTALKLILREAVNAGRAGQVFYFSFDLAREHTLPVEVYREARRIRGTSGDGPWLVLWDEVSAVPDWPRAIKYLRDQTGARDDCLVLSGSSARDLRTAGERLPGRRGKVARPDRILLPMSFREWLAARGEHPPSDRPLRLHQLLEMTGPSRLREAVVALPRLERLFADYLVTGGFPEALHDFLNSGTIAESTIRVLWETAAGDLARWGRDRMTAFGLLDRVVRSAGSPISWNSLADDIDVASSKTAQEYVQLLADAFLLLQIHHWDTGRGRVSPKKQKKIYPADPLLSLIPSLLRPGAAGMDITRKVESLVAMTLFRAEEVEPVESMGLPRALFYTRTAAGSEIDFLVRSTRASIPVEVAYGEQTRKGKTIESMMRRFGRGVLVTRSTFEPDRDVRQIPAPLFCALLDSTGPSP